MKKLLTIISALLFVFLLPVFASAQTVNLRIEKFSVYSTLPERDGFRRVSVSFRVVNKGVKSTSPPTVTRVSFDDSGVNFATPSLTGPPLVTTLTLAAEPTKPSEAYITRSIRTTAAQLNITVQTDASNGGSNPFSIADRLQFTAILNLQAGRWRSIGPSRIEDREGTFGPTLGVGRVTTIAVEPTAPFSIYLGARGSGIWKSADAGRTWFPVGDSLPSAQIDAIGIDPRNPQRVLVATPAGVFESTTGGSVWIMLTAEDLEARGGGGGALLIANKSNPPIYVSTVKGLRVSTDGGHTWPTVRFPGFPEGIPAPRVVSLQFSTTDQSHLFASTRDIPGVFEAKDGGLSSGSWRMLTGCGEHPLPVFPPDAIAWIAESGGHRWVSFRVETATGKFVELWRSTDTVCPKNGFIEQSWEKVPLRGDCGKGATSFSYLFAHPTDPALVFKGGQVLCRSTQSGTNLSTVDKIHVDHHAIVAARSGFMFFGTDGGIYRSADKGKTMEFVGEGLNNTEFLKIDTDGKSPRIVVGGSQDNFTSTWNGFSPVWTAVSGGDTDLTDSSLVAFNRTDMTGIYEIAQGTPAIRLINPTGGSDELGDSSLPDCRTYNEDPKLLRSMASTGSKPKVLITCKGIWSGPPWKRIQPQPTNPPGDFRRLKLHPSGILVAVTDTGHVFFGRFDQPPLLDAFHTPRPATPTAISFDQLNRFYVSTNSTNSAGAITGSIHRLECFFTCVPEDVWSTPGEIMAITIDPLAPNTLLAAVRDRGVFRGVRSAQKIWSWTEFNNGMPFGVTVTDLEPQSNGGIIAATYGRGAFQLFSRFTTPPPPPTAVGFVILYEASRAFPDQPPGEHNPIIQTIELDSKPGFIFTATGGPVFRAVVNAARENNRKVEITFTPIIGSQSSGNIVSVKLK